MTEREYFADDRLIIPDFIKSMTFEQTQKVIAEIEAFPEKANSILEKLERDYKQRKVT